MPDVTVNTTGDIVGKVEVTGGNLTIISGNFLEELVYDSGDLTVTGGAFTDLVNAVKYAVNNATIKLAKSDTGGGLFLGESAAKTITIDFGGYTYTVDSDPVGSSGTENQAMHFEKGNTVTLMNGTLKIANDGNLKMGIQNYCDLTLEDFNIDARESNCGYALSNNNGDVKILGSSSIRAADGKVAFDVYVTGHYPDGARVVVDTTGEIVGKVEYGVWGTIPNPNNTLLTIKNGTFIGGFVIDNSLIEAAKTRIVIEGGVFDWDPEPYVAEGYEAIKDNDKWVVSVDDSSV